MYRPLRVALSCVGTLLVLIGVVAGTVNREVLDADRFAAHVDAVRTDPDVARELGALLTRRLLDEQPDLVAIRPLIESTATAVVASSTLGPIVRGSVSTLYDALVLGEDDPVVLRLADVAAVVVAAVTALAPQTAISVPADLDVRLSDIGAGELGSDVVGPVHLVRLLSWLAPLLGLLLLAGAGASTGASAGASAGARGALAEVGRGALAAAGLLAGLLVVAAALVGRSDADTLPGAVRLAGWDAVAPAGWLAAAVVAAGGGVLALVAGPVTDGTRDLVRAGVLITVGVALVVDPARVATALLWLAGAVLLVAGLVLALSALARLPAARSWGAVGLVVLLAATVVGAWPGDRHLEAGGSAAAGAEECNGHAELCARRYDEVAFAATHNAMAAASEPGWFFPEQPDGLRDQLDAGVRVLLIDSWYGRETNRANVATTVGDARSRAIAELEEAFGAAAVRSALRLHDALGLAPRGARKTFLCHALCELGSTPMRRALDDVRGWLEAHPREVVTLVVQDEVSPADTAALMQDVGLLPYVQAPREGEEWPTLGQMVESGKRLVVFMEHRDGGTEHPWLLPAFDWIQDTPFLFRSPAALIEGSDTCALHRGTADAPLLLVNHWVTDKTAEVTHAARVNAEAVLSERVERCRSERGMIPNYVAVDFYDRGDLLAVVDSLNGLG